MGKHCAPAVERGCEAVGVAECGPALGGGRSVGEDSVGGHCAAEEVEVAAAVADDEGEEDGVGASAGSLTAVVGVLQADMTD